MYFILLFLYTLLDFCSAVASPGSGLTLAVERVPRTRSMLRRDVIPNSISEVEAIKNGTDWITSITVGGQILRVQIATALDSTWVLSSRANAQTLFDYSNHRFYNDSKSSTSDLNTNLLWNATVNDNNVFLAGIGGTDTVNIGGWQVEDMLFGMATSVGVNAVDIDSSVDGMLGLARTPTGVDCLSNHKSEALPNDDIVVWTDISKQNGTHVSEPTFLQLIQKQWPAVVFTCNFRANQPETISFGTVNSSLYTGTLSEIPIDDSTGFWLTSAANVSSNGNVLKSSPLPMIFDTAGQGTTLDGPTVKAYWELVPGAHVVAGTEWLFPCNTTTLPDLTLTFTNGAAVTLPGSALNETTFTYDGIICIAGLQPVEQSRYPNIGNAFFGKYFSVWNFTAPSISFAPYSDVQDTSGLNVANLPTATDAAGVPKATGILTMTAATPSPTKSAAGIGLNMAVGSACRLLLSLFAAILLVQML